MLQQNQLYCFNEKVFTYNFDNSEEMTEKLKLRILKKIWYLFYGNKDYSA